MKYLEYLDEFSKQHRQYQKEAIESLSSQDLGSCYLPTGTGKTRVQIALHMIEMVKNLNENKAGIYVIGAHRLILCQQLLDELVNVVGNCGIQFSILFIGSSRQDQSEYNDGLLKDYGFNAHIKYTTCKEEIVDFIKNSQKRGIQTLVVSTYHSFDKLDSLDEISICTFDEAHSTTETRFHKNILKVRGKIQKCYFFTATKRIINKVGGMADEKFYGPENYKRSPKEMIDQMEIVPPVYHIISIKTIEKEEVYDGIKMLVKTICDGFHQHKSVIKKISACPQALGAKMIATTNGTDELISIHDDSDFKKYCKDNKIRVFAIYSQNDGYFIDFQRVSRKEILEKMRNLKDEEDAIFLHIRILSEGVDLPSITGVLLLRNIQLLELTQTVGRAMRLLKSDRISYYSGNIDSNETKKFFQKDQQGKFQSKINELIKPCCFVIIPKNFEAIANNLSELRKMIEEIYSKYDIPIDTICRDDEFTTKTAKDLPKITSDDKTESREKISDLDHMIQDIIISQFHQNKSGNEIQHILDICSQVWKARQKQ